MTHSGLKALAQELPKHGRYGDSIVAHINPQEAALLKAMGGSGTINPVTGLPEYWGGLGALNPVKAISNAWGGVSKLPGFNAIDKGLVGIDKAVGSAIPGGWGTLASVAGSAVGLPTWALTGLGALNGSGMLRSNGKFNLQGALMGGAMAYGMANLGEAVRAADIGAYDPSAGLTSAGESANAAGNSFSYTPSGEMVPSNVAPNITGANISDSAFNAAQSNIDPSALEGMSKADVVNAKVLPTTPNAAPSYLDARMADLSSTGRGLANLSGLAGGEGTAAAARAAVDSSAATLKNTALPIVVGGTGLMALKEQEDSLNQANAAGAVSQADYNTQMAKINDAKARANTAMEANPYQFAEGGEVKGYAFGGGIFQSIADKIQNDPSFLAKLQNSQSTPSSSGGGFGSGLMQQIANDPSFLEQVKKTPQALAEQALKDHPYQFAMGGTVSNPPDDQTGMINQSPMTNLDQGGLMSMVNRTVPQQMFAAGGMAAGRFLSGGGDGLSDDIPAIIGNKQPAKLADGEFVVSSDVVSGLGGGSSKAGAKKLYAMMDRVRKQAHGTKKQIRPVSTKALPA